MKKKLGKFMEEIPYWVNNLIALIAGIFGIVGGVIAVIFFFLPNKEAQFQAIALTILPIILLVLVLFKMFKFNRLYKDSRILFSKNFYIFLKSTRNTYFELVSNYKDHCGNQDTCIRLLAEITKKYFEEGLDSLCDIMEAITGEKVSACVKIIEFDNGAIDCSNPENVSVKTFTRSKEKKSERIEIDSNGNIPKLLNENSDFSEIVNNGLPYFYQQDLMKYKADPDVKYLNTTPNFEKHYKSTIVVPIRIRRELLFYTENVTGYDIIGFLCIDSLSTKAFLNKEPEKTVNINVMKSFSSEIYIILSKFKFYLDKIAKNKKEDEKTW